MRLVFACEGGNWMPMVLTQEGYLGSPSPYFSYNFFELGDFNYIEESVTISDGVNYFVYQRVLAVYDHFVQPSIKPSLNIAGVQYFELIEVMPYQHPLSLPVYMVAYNTASFPQVIQNWLDCNNLSNDVPNNLPNEQLNIANARLQEATILQQQAEAKLAKTQELFLQAQKELALIEQARKNIVNEKQNDNLQTHEDVIPKAEVAMLPVDALQASADKQIEEVSNGQAIKDTSEEKLSNLESTVVSLSLTESLPKVNPQGPVLPIAHDAKQSLTNLDEPLTPESSLLAKSSSKNPQEHKLNFIDVLDNLAENLKNNGTLNDNVFKDLKNIECLLISNTQKDLFVDKLKGISIDFCVKLLVDANVASNIKELLLKILVSYADPQYYLIDESSCLVELAKTLTVDKDLFKKVKRQKLRKVVYQLDFDEFVKLTKDDAHYAKYGYDLLVKFLPHVTVDKSHNLIKFVGLKEFALEFCINILQDLKMPSHVRMVFMYKLQELSAEEYYIQDQKNNFNQMYESFSSYKIQDIALQNMLALRKTEAQQWFLGKSKEIFAVFNGSKTKKIDNALLPLFSQEVNEQGQTLLMLAIQKQHSMEKIRIIIQASGRSILFADNNNQNIFHYFANYCHSSTISLFKGIRKLFEVEAKKANLNIVEEVNRRDLMHGNTYLHCLLQGKKQESVLAVLKQIFISSDNTDCLEPFYITILLRNNAFDSISTMLDSKTQEWMEVRELLYSNIAKILFKLDGKFYKDLHAAATGGFFYKSSTQDVIFSLLKSNDFKRLIYILEARAQLLNNIIKELAQQKALVESNDGNQQVVQEQVNVIFNYFYLPVFNKISYKGKNLHKCFAEFIVANNDAALEKTYCNSLCLKANPPASIMDTVQWAKIRALVSKKIYEMDHDKGVSKAEDKIETIAVKNFAHYVLTTPGYADDFIRLAKDVKNSEVFAAILSSTNMEDCIKFMHRVANILHENVDNFIILDNIVYRLRDEVFEALMMYLVGSCLVSNNVPLIQHVLKTDGFIVDHYVIDIVLNDVNKDSLEVFQCVLSQYIDVSSMSQEVIAQRVYYLYASAIDKRIDFSIIEFLLTKYDPLGCAYNGNNILVRLFFSIAEGKAPSNDLSWVLKFVQALFADQGRAQEVAQTSKAMCFLGIIGTHKNVDITNLIIMFKLFLAHGAKFNDLVFGLKNNPIQYAVNIGSLELLNLFVQYINKEDLYSMLTDKDNNCGKNILEGVEQEVEAGKLDEEILDRLEELHNQSNPNPVSRILAKMLS